MANPEVDAASSHRPRRGKRWGRWILRILIVGVVLLVGLELFARYYLGLGDPPLWVADPEIEYMYAPSQEAHRVGHFIRYNAFSMRSDDFKKTKSDPGELRVMFLGDSVLNGGALIDQQELATELLKKRLTERFGRRVVVGNISAGSWGPPNLLAYIKRFGFFDADVVVFIFSSHDYSDVPTFEDVVGKPRGFPNRKPFALQEAIVRYVWPAIMNFNSDPMPPAPPATPEQIQQAMSAMREVIERAKSTGATVIVAQHAERGELAGNLMPGHDVIRDTVSEAGVTLIDLLPAEDLAQAQQRNPLHDEVHPTAAGQALIADELFDPILRALESRHGTATTVPATQPAAASRAVDG